MILTTLVIVIHVIVCVALIMIILLQTGKGADIGAAFGGGAGQTVFGSSGATPFLSKVTIAAAVIFMITSTFLTYFAGRTTSGSERSIMSDQAVPIESPVPGAPPARTGDVPATTAPNAPAKSEVPVPAAPVAPAAPVPSPAPAAPTETPAPAK